MHTAHFSRQPAHGSWVDGCGVPFLVHTHTLLIAHAHGGRHSSCPEHALAHTTTPSEVPAENSAAHPERSLHFLRRTLLSAATSKPCIISSPTPNADKPQYHIPTKSIPTRNNLWRCSGTEEQHLSAGASGRGERWVCKASSELAPHPCVLAYRTLCRRWKALGPWRS